MGILDAAKRFIGNITGGNKPAPAKPAPQQFSTTKLSTAGNVGVGTNPPQTKITVGSPSGGSVKGTSTPNPYTAAPKPTPTPLPQPQAPRPTAPAAPSQQPQQQAPQQQEQRREEPQQSFQESVPSAEDAAAKAAEERMSKYNTLVAPVQKDIESYLASRPDLNKLFQEQLTAQGVPARQATLGGFEKDVTNLQGQLSTLPTEDINRRKETGMLTAAAERRIRSQEERPIREQILKTQGAVESERVGLQRAYDLIDKLLDMQKEQEKRGLEPLQTRLSAGQGEFKEEVDVLSSKLSGFNKDREGQLDLLKQKIANAQQLTLAERKEAADLVKLEAQHLNTMQELALKQKGQQIDVDNLPVIEEVQSRIMSGATREEVLTDYRDLLDISVLEKVFDKYGSIFTTNEGSTGGNPYAAAGGTQ